MEQIILDSQQVSVMEDLNKISRVLVRRGLLNQLKNFFKFSKKALDPKGIYLYGTVGGGKTSLMRIFFHKLDIKKKFFHYQEFMQMIHKEFFVLQYSKKIIENFVQKNFVTPNIKLICIDELDIQDISDAMIFSEIFTQFMKYKVFMFITNNIAPKDLYKDGLQRASFIPTIDKIKKYFTVLSLENKDYRYNTEIKDSSGRFFYPINQANKVSFRNILNICTKSFPLERNKEILVNHRKFKFQAIGNDLLLTNFYELFIRDLSYLDYIFLSKRYKIFFLENIRVIENIEHSTILRFINFVDHIYFNKNILYATSEVAVERIYSGIFYQKEFLRTKSRIAEICVN